MEKKSPCNWFWSPCHFYPAFCIMTRVFSDSQALKKSLKFVIVHLKAIVMTQNSDGKESVGFRWPDCTLAQH